LSCEVAAGNLAYQRGTQTSYPPFKPAGPGAARRAHTLPRCVARAARALRCSGLLFGAALSDLRFCQPGVMQMARLKPVMQYELGHLLSREVDRRADRVKTTSKYQVRPVSFARPSEGSVVESRACPRCGAHLRVKVASVAETRRERLRHLRLAGVSLIVGLILAAASVYALKRVSPQLLAFPVVFATVVALIATVGGLMSALTDSGVDWAPDLPRSLKAEHKLLIIKKHT
jgi:hypothetical protein